MITASAGGGTLVVLSVLAIVAAGVGVVVALLALVVVRGVRREEASWSLSAPKPDDPVRLLARRIMGIYVHGRQGSADDRLDGGAPPEVAGAELPAEKGSE